MEYHAQAISNALSPQYRYEPLHNGQIRIICLKPGAPGEALHAELEVMELTDSEPPRTSLTEFEPKSIWSFFNEDENKNPFRPLRSLVAKLSTSSDEIKAELSNLQDLDDRIQALYSKQRDAVGSDESTGDVKPYAGDIGKDIRDLEISMAISLLRQIEAEKDRLVSITRNAGGYEALSYAWGSSNKVREISLQDGESIIPITESLHTALQAIRLKSDTRRLWIDAICINQSNRVEKELQIAMMAKIYQSACRTLVWLGQADDFETTAMAIGNAMIAEKCLTLGAPAYGVLWTKMASCGCCGEMLPNSFTPTHEHAAEALARLEAKSWFHRLWVIQEVALARHVEVLCGSHRMPWAIFDDWVFGRPMHDYNDFTSLDIQNVVDDAINLPHSPHRLIYFLTLSASRGCQDPRDRIFAIKASTHLPSTGALALSYDQSHTEIYARVAAYCLTSEENWTDSCSDIFALTTPHMSIIFALACAEGRSDGWPSWVPDFDNLPRKTQVKCAEYQYIAGLYEFWDDTEKKQITMSRSLQCRAGRSWREIQVKAASVGYVHAVLDSSSCPQEYPVPFYEVPKYAARKSLSQDTELDRRNVLNWYFKCRDFASEYLDRRDFHVRFKELLLIANESTSRTYVALMNNRQPLNGKYSREYDDIPPPSEFLRNLAAVHGVKEQNLSEDTIANWTIDTFFVSSDVISGVDRYDRDRHMGAISISDGPFDKPCVGWLPPEARAGDQVFAVDGAPRLLIVRPSGESDGTFTLVGECWIYEFDKKQRWEWYREHKDAFDWITFR